MPKIDKLKVQDTLYNLSVNAEDVEGLEQVQYEDMPEATADNENKIVQYVGETDSDYTNSQFYKNIKTVVPYTGIYVVDGGSYHTFTIADNPLANGYKIVYKFKTINTLMDSNGVFFTLTGGSGNELKFRLSSNKFAIIGGPNYYSNVALLKNTEYTVEILNSNNSTGYVKVNNETILSNLSSNVTSAKTLKILLYNLIVQRLQIFDNEGQLVRDFIGTIDSENKACIQDTITRTYYYIDSASSYQSQLHYQEAGNHYNWEQINTNGYPEFLTIKTSQFSSGFDAFYYTVTKAIQEEFNRLCHKYGKPVPIYLALNISTGGSEGIFYPDLTNPNEPNGVYHFKLNIQRGGTSGSTSFDYYSNVYASATVSYSNGVYSLPNQIYFRQTQLPYLTSTAPFTPTNKYDLVPKLYVDKKTDLINVDSGTANMIYLKSDTGNLTIEPLAPGDDYLTPLNIKLLYTYTSAQKIHTGTSFNIDGTIKLGGGAYLYVKLKRGNTELANWNTPYTNYSATGTHISFDFSFEREIDILPDDTFEISLSNGSTTAGYGYVSSYESPFVITQFGNAISANSLIDTIGGVSKSQHEWNEQFAQGGGSTPTTYVLNYNATDEELLEVFTAWLDEYRTTGVKNNIVLSPYIPEDDFITDYIPTIVTVMLNSDDLDIVDTVRILCNNNDVLASGNIFILDFVYDYENDTWLIFKGNEQGDYAYRMFIYDEETEETTVETNFLATDIPEGNEDYMPEYDWQPANKKYVDEKGSAQYEEMPEATSENDKAILQYVGETGSDYINGQFYKNIHTVIPYSYIHAPGYESDVAFRLYGSYTPYVYIFYRFSTTDLIPNNWSRILSVVGTGASPTFYAISNANNKFRLEYSGGNVDSEIEITPNTEYEIIISASDRYGFVKINDETFIDNIELYVTNPSYMEINIRNIKFQDLHIENGSGDYLFNYTAFKDNDNKACIKDTVSDTLKYPWSSSTQDYIQYVEERDTYDWTPIDTNVSQGAADIIKYYDATTNSYWVYPYQSGGTNVCDEKFLNLFYEECLKHKATGKSVMYIVNTQMGSVFFMTEPTAPIATDGVFQITSLNSIIKGTTNNGTDTIYLHRLQLKGTMQNTGKLRGTTRYATGASSMQYTFISKTSTTAYTPTSDYHPANKKYVDDSIAAAITDAIEGEY